MWFNNSAILYFVVSSLLVVALLLHVIVAVSRQLDSNKKRDIMYKKPYPKAIPRSIAWTGAVILLTFIILHVYQMLSVSFGLHEYDLYEHLLTVFSNPLMWLVYGFWLTFISSTFTSQLR